MPKRARIPGEVRTASEATEIALAFLKKYRRFARPLKAIRENDIWYVEIDVGPLTADVARVQIDAKTGDILEYNVTEAGIGSKKSGSKV